MQKINHKIIEGLGCFRSLMTPLKIKKSPRGQIIKLWLPVIFYAGLIFLISSIPRTYFPSGFYSMDKIFHLIEYLIFGLLLSRAIKNSFLGLNRINLCIIVTLVAINYGMSDEFHQLFVVGKQASGWDILVDGIGGLIAGLIYK